MEASRHHTVTLLDDFNRRSLICNNISMDFITAISISAAARPHANSIKNYLTAACLTPVKIIRSITAGLKIVFISI
jgi:hypothetical protein